MRFGGDSGLMGRAADGERGSAEACAARAALVGWWPAMVLRSSTPRLHLGSCARLHHRQRLVVRPAPTVARPAVARPIAA